MFMECLRVNEEIENKTVKELFLAAGNEEKACIVLMKGGPNKMIVKTMEDGDQGCCTMITGDITCNEIKSQ